VTTKVLDFGIAVIAQRVLAPLPGPSPALAMGTSAYLSPEHILGAAQIDGRADVYGFGVLLFEALTGQLPFSGEPGPELLDQVLHKTAPLVTLFRPDLPPGLARIIETAMAKDPKQRYADLNLMASALEDELMPPTPPALLLAPAVQVAAKPEPSKPHQETQILFGPPQTPESKESGASKEFAPTVRETILVNLRPSLGRRPKSASPLPAWRGLAGAGLAVVLGILAVWIIMRSAPEVQTGAPALVGVNDTPPAREPIVLPAPPVVVPIAALAPAAVLAAVADPSPLAPRSIAVRAHGKRASRLRAMPVSAPPSRPPGSEPMQPPAPTAGGLAKAAAPRAGHLSRDDF
jgi:serine/threonine-protein kinase